MPQIQFFDVKVVPQIQFIVSSPSQTSPRVPRFLSRRWRNSWWMCRRLFPIPRFSGLWSSSSTFQFLVVEDQVLVFKVFPLDRVQQRRLPRNAFLSGLWSRSLTLFLVEVFLVHLLLTLQLVLMNALMNLVKGFFRIFPQIKNKVRRLLRTRGRNCSPSRAHPRRLLSWRAPSSGCGSGNAMLARLSSGTDVLTVQSGGLQLVSRSCGTAKGMRRERCASGTGTRVPPRLTSLLFLLSEELHRQPRAVYKYWASCRLCWEDTYAVSWFLYGPSYLAVTCSLFSLVRQWIHVTSVYSGFCGRLPKMFRFQHNAWFDSGSGR